MTKLKNLTFNEKIIIILNLLYYIVGAFINIFFIAKFIKYTDDNLVTVCLYFIVAFIARMIGGVILGAISKTFPNGNKEILKWGFIIRGIMILLTIFLNESTKYYFLIMGLTYGISEMCYHFGNDLLSIDVTNIENRAAYVNIRQTLTNILGIFAPYFLGKIMVNYSFAYCGYLVFGICVICAILCKFIKIHVDEDDFYDYENEENNKKDTFNFLPFIKKVHDDKLSLISAFFFAATLYGIFESAMLTTRLKAVLDAFGDMDNFGLIYSIFSLIGFITILLYRKYRKDNTTQFVIASSIMIFIALLAEINNYSNGIAAIVFGACLNISNIIIGSMFSTVKGNVTNNYSIGNCTAEYIAHQSVYQNIGRILSYLLLLISNLSGLQILFRIVMVILALSGVIAAIILNYINSEIGNSKFH